MTKIAIEIREYKYKELCELMKEPIKTGKSRQLQLENWRRYFEWDKPTSQIYKITKIYDVPKEKKDRRKNNGGSRSGSGAKMKMKEEFEVLFSRFVYDELNKNEYFYYGQRWIYFDNEQINKYFGIYRDIYKARYLSMIGETGDRELNTDVFREIVDKLREKSRSWIFGKIKKVENIHLSEGIIIEGESYTFCDFDDELIQVYKEAEKGFLKERDFKSKKDVVDTNTWREMKAYIKKRVLKSLEKDGMLPVKYENCKEIKMYHKLIIEPEFRLDKTKLNFEDVKRMKRNVNEKVIQELYEFFLKKNIEGYLNGEQYDEEVVMRDYTHILEQYVKLKES